MQGFQLNPRKARFYGAGSPGCDEVILVSVLIQGNDGVRTGGVTAHSHNRSRDRT